MGAPNQEDLRQVQRESSSAQGLATDTTPFRCHLFWTCPCAGFPGANRPDGAASGLSTPHTPVCRCANLSCKLKPMASLSAPAGRKVGPSVVGRLLGDRSLRLAVGLAVAVAIPVAILFYFQFRSIADLGQSSAVVLRQLSQETANDLTASVEECAQGAVHQRPAAHHPATDRTAEPAGHRRDVRAGARDRAVHQSVLRLVGRHGRAPRRSAGVRSGESTGSSRTRRKARCWSVASGNWRRKSVRSPSSRQPSTDAARTSRRSSGSSFPRATRSPASWPCAWTRNASGRSTSPA